VADPTDASGTEALAPGAGVGRRRISRRAFVRGAAGAVGLPAIRETMGLEVTRTDIAVRKLPEGISGFTIALLADIHYSFIHPLEHVRRAVDLTNSLRPDLIALAGDYTWHGAGRMAPVFRELGRLRAPYGVFAVLGNHDYWDSASAARQAMAAAGIPELCNDNAKIWTDNGSFYLAGLDDPWAGKPRMEKALGGIPTVRPVVMLAHQPVCVEKVTDDRVSLMLSGHTHGGQIVLPGIGAPIIPGPRKYTSGLVQGPHCPVYITRGIGYAGVPLRINCPPEVALITLQPVLAS
jgi:predicted MPP superfamily phosphohydrolase